MKGARFDLTTKKSKRHCGICILYNFQLVVYRMATRVHICHLYHVGGCDKLDSCHYDDFMNNKQKYRDYMRGREIYELSNVGLVESCGEVPVEVCSMVLGLHQIGGGKTIPLVDFMATNSSQYI